MGFNSAFKGLNYITPSQKKFTTMKQINKFFGQKRRNGSQNA